jgi:hypothetical protein
MIVVGVRGCGSGESVASGRLQLAGMGPEVLVIAGGRSSMYSRVSVSG